MRIRKRDKPKISRLDDSQVIPKSRFYGEYNKFGFEEAEFETLSEEGL